jgi:uncharacterized protein (DUF433 family)
MATRKLYNGRDPRDLPAYSVGEAARYLRVPSATLRSWVAGRQYPRGAGLASFEPLMRPADPGGLRLSFTNLVEAHVLHALRTHHAVPIRHIRTAIQYAERELAISRLLLSEELHTHAGELFLDYLGQLISLSRSGQLAVRKLLEAHLQRVERDTASLPIRLYPFLTAPVVDGPKHIVIDPGVSFGRPTLTGYGVTTRVLAQRIDAGESPDDLAEDYGIRRELIEEAALFEQAA